MVTTILQIILASLELTTEVIKGIPVEKRQEFWTKQEAQMKFWTDLFEKLGGTKIELPKPPEVKP
jgi:hypothetical protein